MPLAAGVKIKDEAALKRDLAAAPKALKAALRASHGKLAREVRGWIRSGATHGTRQQARMARGIGSTASSTNAAITVRNTPTNKSGKTGAPGARGAYFGGKRPGLPPWVGQNWKVGAKGQGPYIINPALAAHERDIDDLYLLPQRDVIRRALNHP